RASLLLLSLGLIGAGVSGPAIAQRKEGPKQAPPVLKQPQPERKDLYGDALPAGAVARGGTVRFRHRSTAIAYSPDGKFLASGGGLDGTAKLWAPLTGTRLQQFTGLAKINPWRFNHDSALAIAPDSKTLAVTARKAIVLYDVASGAERLRFEGHVYGI